MPITQAQGSDTALQQVQEQGSDTALQQVQEQGSDTALQQVQEQGSDTALQQVQEQGSDTALQQVQEQGSDTALQQVEQTKGSAETVLERDLKRLFHAHNELYDVLLKLRAMKTYNPDFTATVADGKEKLEKMLQANQIIDYLREPRQWLERHLLHKTRYRLNDNKNVDFWERVSYPTLQLRAEFKNLTEGIAGQELDVIGWTVWQSEQGRVVGIDYQDVEHYRAVKDILTAANYEGVSVHYFFEGKSYRGVAELVHPELLTKVRVGSRVIDIAQISGVLITRRPIYDVVVEKNRPLLAVKRPQTIDLHTHEIAAPRDLFAHLPLPADYKYASRWYDDAYTEARETAGAHIVWWGRVNKHQRDAEFYSDGYGELHVYTADVGRERVLTFAEGREGFDVFARLTASPALTLPERSGITWENYSSDILADVYGDGVSVLGITNEYLRYYLETKGMLTASDYEGVLVHYREGDSRHTAQVIRAHEGENSNAVVVDLITDAEKVIAVRDIQGVLFSQHADYGKAVTFKVDDMTYYGEAFLVFSNDELSVLVHGTRQGEGELELLDDKYTIAVSRDEEGLVIH